MTGQFDPSAGALTLSGGQFSLTGSLRAGVLAGNYSGANSSGGFSTLNSTSTSITVFCGTFSFPQVVPVTGTKPAESGLWNLQVSGNGRASGVAAGNVPPAVPLTGTVGGNTVSLETSEGGLGMGTISNGTVTGTAFKGGS